MNTQLSLFTPQRVKITQLDRVRRVMADQQWRSLPQIADATMYRFHKLDSPQALSARLRDLRKEGFTVDKKVSKPGSGLFLYRVSKG